MTRHIKSLEDYRARPSQSLGDHLDGVATGVERLLPADETTAYGDDWQKVGSAIAWTHDAGKLTTYFADYLDTNDRTAHDKSRPEYTYHGFVSALLSAQVLYSLDISAEARKAGFYAVAKHHSVLPAVASAEKNYIDPRERVASKYKIAREQLTNIDSHASDAIDDLLDVASNGNLGWDDVYIDSPTAYRRLLREPAALDDQFYGTLLRAWSTLVCADKLDAANIEIPTSTEQPSVETLAENVESLPSGETELKRELNILRNRAHEESTNTLLEAHHDGKRFFRLTLPTGFGKTLTGLRAALELATERDERIIYALPYTSILDQVDSVCQKFLNVDPADRAYTVHHHLADTRTNLEELRTGDHVSDGSEVIYAETWQSGIVLTTFTQLFESLAGPGNTQSMKLPALQDSVILIDEPQGISIDWWGLVSRLTRFVNREYDATVIMMTATQPQILERNPDHPTPVALTSETDACLEFLGTHPRVEFELHDSLIKYLDLKSAPLPIDDAAEELYSTVEPGTNTLSVVNTIESAATLTETLCTNAGQTGIQLADGLIEFYRQRQTKSQDELAEVASSYLKFIADRTEITADTTLISTLTTRVRPRDRGLLLEALRQILDADTSTPFDGCRTITVSTQLIEAGVDISFDRLYRDFAPLPAIVQAAGRCNREYDGNIGTVTIWRLASARDDGPVPSALIYGRKALLRPTRHALEALRDEHGTVLPESAVVSSGVDEYYDSLHQQRRTADREDTLTYAFDTGDGDKLRRASLIDQDYETQDIAVLLSERDHDQFKQYQDRRESDQWKAAKDAFTKLKPCIVTVPIENSDSHDDTENRLRVLKRNRAVDDYEVATGRGASIESASLAVER